MERGGAERLIVVLSDIEMGGGGVLDDFPHSEFLASLLQAYARPPFNDLEVDVVFNGDTFDFLKTAVNGTYPTRITAEVALEKVRSVHAAHEAFFEGVERWLSTGLGRRRVHFVVGNHDLELLFPEVQAEIRRLLGGRHVYFPGWEVEFGDLLVTHGNMKDPMFAMNPKRHFVEHGGETILNLPWGAVMLLDVALPLQPVMYALDRLKPRARVFELLPEVRDFMVSKFWSYWTQDWFRGWQGGDPIRRVRWPMVKELLYRFGTLDPDLTEGGEYRALLLDSDKYRVVCIGHYHQAAWWSVGDKKLLINGCFRDEFMMDEAGTITRPLPKTYAEVYQRGSVTVRSHLVEVDGPPSPVGHVPNSVFDVLDKIRPLIEPEDEALAKARQEEELREATAEEPVDASNVPDIEQ